jgi:DNA-binding MarR family transcriptional regulator
MSFEEEIVQDEEEVVNETEEVIGETEEVVNETEEEVVREEPIKVIPKKKLQKNLLELLNDFRYSLYNLYNKEDKQLKILILLYRKESLHVRKIEELTKTSGAYTKRYLNELEAFGLVQRYNVSPDPRVYYKLTPKGKIFVDFVLNLLNGE